ncbi:MAG: tetratricopeptide repeat protein [Oscillatoriaceae bacterium SKW80]|nr:tetratricopeptide repeat protein [Oscillatoriaceae bacterium SKYG93]MCX8120138.1 tetratricopeptide repeat protein [Oscillatoriaceae bacterium SKW80]
MAIQDFTQAVLQLKDALKIEPKNSRCHALLGMVYLKQNQPTLAKVHIKNALQLNPNEPVALEAQKMLEKPQKPGDKKNKKGNSEQGGGGFFGSLFGGGKKK